MATARFFLRAAPLILGLAWALCSPAQEIAPQSTAPAPAPASAAVDPNAEKAAAVKDLLREASDLAGHGKLEQALPEIDTALEIDPKNVLAYQLRASIYTAKKLWDRAAEDYATAYKLAPSATVYKYNIAQIQFMQKAYDNARPGFLALQNDPMLGDLSRYQVFLCDMLSRRDAVAAQELDALNQAGASPAYYYANAAWALYHDNRTEANKWFVSATHLYDQSTNAIYLNSLIQAGSAQGTMVSFVTKGGVKYDQTKAYVEGDGLRVLTPNGWSTIPFDQVPDDLSVFPAEFAKEIMDRIHLSPLAPNRIKWATFTTKDGRHYDKVQVDVDNTGLSVLTSDGWLTIPFQQLPEDLSPFPDEVQKEIAEKRLLAPDISRGPSLYTFVTKSGNHYDSVRVVVTDAGLNVLTSDGWLTVPFKDLPDDLSIFPADMREAIATKRQAAPDDSLNLSLFTFTTKTGKHYDQVQVSADKDGLSVLTPDGTFTVPYPQLPDDLSVFPATLQKKIRDMAEQAALAAKPSANLPPVPPPNLVPSSAPGTGDIDPEQKDLHPAGAGDCLFGHCLAMEGSTLVVGGNGATYVYEDGQLKARLCPDADATHTGEPVNSVSISNHTIALATRKGIYILAGTPQGWKLVTLLALANATTVALDHDRLVATTDGKGITGGTVAFYTLQNGTWRSVPRDVKQDEIDYSADNFGHLVALKGDWALVGAPNWSSASFDNIGSDYAGRVYVEKYDGTRWQEQNVLTPDDNGVGANQFGASVALSDDYIAVSSFNHDHVDYAPHHGIVYLFRKDVDDWKEDATIKSPNPTNDEGFGCAPIVLSQDILAICDPLRKVYVPDVVSVSGDRSGKPGEIKQAGAVYVYDNQILQATLLAPDPMDGLTGHGSPDRYARSMAISGDTIAVGAEGRDGGAGAVYLWKRMDGQWHLASEIKGFHKQVDFQY